MWESCQIQEKKERKFLNVKEIWYGEKVTKYNRRGEKVVVKYNRESEKMRKLAEPKRKSVRWYKVKERMCKRVLK